MYSTNYSFEPKKETIVGKKVVIHKSGRTGIVESILVDEHENQVYEVSFNGYSSENFFDRSEFTTQDEIIKQNELNKTHNIVISILWLITMAVVCTCGGLLLGKFLIKYNILG